MVVVAKEKQEGGGRREEGGGRKEATNIKSNNPHLAGGEKLPEGLPDLDPLGSVWINVHPGWGEHMLKQIMNH